VGAVGPTSNVVMGQQNMGFMPDKMIVQTSFLIGFCMMIRKSTLIKVGGVDDSLPGGDDLDLSIRLDDKGYILLIDRNVFIYHYGFQTGNRLHGDSMKKNGWNNYASTERTNFGLIRKHGFRRWYECLSGIMHTKIMPTYLQERTDTEGEIICSMVKGEVVYEFGCGATKTVPEAIGFDIVPKGHHIDTISNVLSVADECFDVTKPFPDRIRLCNVIIARHILEHCIDSVKTLKNWKKVLRANGKLIIAVPNQDFFNTIPVNIEHVHAFTPLSLQSLLEEVGFTDIRITEAKNGVSFIAEATNI